MLDKLFESTVKAEEKIISKVLQQVLQRESTPEDWQECEMIQKVGCMDSYFIEYKGNKLGMIQRKVNEKDLVFTLTVTFIPVSDLN